MERTGLKTQFLRESDVPGTYDRIASVASIAPPQLQREVIEVDDLDPTDEVKKKIVGLIDAGEFSAVLNFDPDEQSHKDLEADLHARLTRNYQIALPFDDTLYTAGGHYTIAATVTGFAPQELSAGEVKQAEVTLAVQGKPDYTAPDT